MTSLIGKIDQDKANHYNKTGGTVLCWDVPVKSYFGIDYLTFETGAKFKGVKMIPPGPHFIHTSVQSAERMGFFVWLNGKQIDVYEWDKTLKILIEFNDKQQADRLRLGVKNFNFDSNLGAYPLQSFAKWQKLSCHITEKLIKRLGPKSGIITSTYSEIKRDVDNIDNNDLTEKYDLYNCAKSKFQHYHPNYTEIIQIKSIKNVKASELTALQMDRSKILYDLLNKNFMENNLELLGELQYAFICLLVGQSVRGLEQWKFIIDLLTNCEDALQEKPSFYFEFVDILIFQFKELPKDFFSDELTNKNFLNQSLQSFMEIANETQLNTALNRKINELKHMLLKRFNKTFDLEDGDGPVVVSLN